MDTIKQRLDIFENASMITAKEREVLEAWVKIIDDYSTNYDKEKLERMITHAAMMMKRQRENESFEELPDEILDSLKEEKVYGDCVSLFNKMNDIYPVNSKEEKYLILHLCSCFAEDGEN